MDAIAVLKQFCDSNLEHVGNKSAFLCGQMKTYRQRNRAQGTAATAKGPDEAKIKVQHAANIAHTVRVLE